MKLLRQRYLQRAKVVLKKNKMSRKSRTRNLQLQIAMIIIIQSGGARKA